MLKRLQAGIARTRDSLAQRLRGVFGGAKLDAASVEEIETILLSADVGVEVTERIIASLRNAGVDNDPERLLDAVREEMRTILAPVEAPLDIAADAPRPYVILVVGVNGVGKTTTIGKLAAQFQQRGLAVMLAAGDTFRAAAIDQLQQWGGRLDLPVIAQQPGADAASVIFDAYTAARTRDADVLLADTAGRLHTKDTLMEELGKIKRVLAKQDAAAPHETLMVLDATTGQNAIAQVRTFHEAVGLDALAITKLDGTAKGGVLLAIAHELQLPIRFIGIGEGVADLQPFYAAEFVDALFLENAPAAADALT